MLHTQGNQLTWRGHATVPITTPIGHGDGRAVGANESEVPRNAQEIFAPRHDAHFRARDLRVETGRFDPLIDAQFI